MIQEEKDSGSIKFSNIIVWQSDYSFVLIESYFINSLMLYSMQPFMELQQGKIYFISLLQEIIQETSSNCQIKMRRDR